MTLVLTIDWIITADYQPIMTWRVQISGYAGKTSERAA
jgi:hypothetical protein